MFTNLNYCVIISPQEVYTQADWRCLQNPRFSGPECRYFRRVRASFGASILMRKAAERSRLLREQEAMPTVFIRCNPSFQHGPAVNGAIGGKRCFLCAAFRFRRHMLRLVRYIADLVTKLKDDSLDPVASENEDTGLIPRLMPEDAVPASFERNEDGDSHGA